MSRRPAILGERRWIGLAILVCLALGQAVTMVVTAFGTRDVFAYLRDRGAEPPTGALVAIALAGTALFVLRAVEGRIAERTGQDYAADIRKALFKHMTRMPTSAVARRRSGALALRYVGDLLAFKGWVSRGLARLISASITIPAAFAILYYLEPWLFWAALGPVCAVIGGMILLSRPLGTAHADLRQKRARLAAAMAERLPQGIALRQSGRINTELRLLSRNSDAIIDAAVRRASLASTVRALPDAGSGLACALCLLVCMHLGLDVPEAVAALTALALIVWPLRHLADVTDRRRAYVVASDKLNRLMAAPRLPIRRRSAPANGALAVSVSGAALHGLKPASFTLQRGEMRRLDGPEGCGKSMLLLMLAGLEACPKSARFAVLGDAPSAIRPGRVLYLGRHAPQLKGSLHRDATMGLGRAPDAEEFTEVMKKAGLDALSERLGGKVAEGRRNLTAGEQARLHLVRGLLSRPDLALIDADEIRLERAMLAQLLDHLACVEAAVLLVTSDPEAVRRLGPAIRLRHASGAQNTPCPVTFVTKEMS